jgi:hypothetical protein
MLLQRLTPVLISRLANKSIAGYGEGLQLASSKPVQHIGHPGKLRPEQVEIEPFDRSVTVPLGPNCHKIYLWLYVLVVKRIPIYLCLRSYS